ncbi:glycosyltransferase family 4 protein [Methanocella arvoryzae]|uniref:Glycosyltransferase (Group 1) n=1 Tax=Methanocella arvoryzae (strain DSM 22066 / NBRC 105507 / MRE50) TaxID=351160 RepID=Q0W814_METAR|nr:glycosyltransferase family 4 protein [Methanocella arvoryzae]CAJ35479.1 glycosyltransferase (group 1) [Methanocella arvoryzae MRE50]
MKIGIVVPYFTPYVRGNEYGLADGLARLGQDVTVLTSTGKAPREKMLKTDYRTENSEPFKVRYLRTLVDLGELPLTPSILGEIRRGGYDVLLLQEDYQPICHLASFAARMSGIPTVLSTERTYFPAGFKRLVLGGFDLTLNAYTRKSATVYTAHCNAARAFAEEHLRVPAGRMRVVNVGVDSGIFRPTEGKTPLTEGKFKILTVARLHPYKGLDTLIRAMQIVVKKAPGAVLYIMGRGPQADELKMLAADLGVSDVVRFVETPVPNTEMPAVYSSADLYVQPSVVEPYGIAVLEAMACGKPTVCSDIGGMRDTVAHGETGFLVPPSDPEALAEKIVLLAGNRERVAEMGTAARKRIVEKFDWPVIAMQYLEIAREIAGRSGK